MSERIALIVWWLAKGASILAIVLAIVLIFTDLAIAAPIALAVSICSWLVGRGVVWVLTGD